MKGLCLYSFISLSENSISEQLFVCQSDCDNIKEEEEQEIKQIKMWSIAEGRKKNYSYDVAF